MQLCEDKKKTTRVLDHIWIWECVYIFYLYQNQCKLTRILLSQLIYRSVCHFHERFEKKNFFRYIRYWYSSYLIQISHFICWSELNPFFLLPIYNSWICASVDSIFNSCVCMTEKGLVSIMHVETEWWFNIYSYIRQNNNKN